MEPAKYFPCRGAFWLQGETGFEADSHCGCCDRLPQEVGGVARRPAEPKGMSSGLVQKCCFLIQEGERSRETAS